MKLDDFRKLGIEIKNTSCYNYTAVKGKLLFLLCANSEEKINLIYDFKHTEYGWKANELIYQNPKLEDDGITAKDILIMIKQNRLENAQKIKDYYKEKFKVLEEEYKNSLDNCVEGLEELEKIEMQDTECSNKT